MADNSAVRVGNKARPTLPLRKVNEDKNDDRHDDDTRNECSVGNYAKDFSG